VALAERDNDQLAERIDRLADALAHHIELTRLGFDEMNRRFEFLTHQFDKRFEQIDKRLDQVDRRFESMQAQMDRRFDALTRRMGPVHDLVLQYHSGHRRHCYWRTAHLALKPNLSTSLPRFLTPQTQLVDK
jgi:exonuclease VII large subunit